MVRNKLKFWNTIHLHTLCSEPSASLQRLPLRTGETVAGLKALGLLTEGVRLGPDGGATLVINGVEVIHKLLSIEGCALFLLIK